MYVALSRITKLEGLFLIGDYNNNAIRVNEDAGKEHDRLRATSINLENSSAENIPIKCPLLAETS